MKTETQATKEVIVTTQLTSKYWKMAQLKCLVILWAGAALILVGVSYGLPLLMGVGFMILFVGACMSIAGDVGTWWNHS